MGRVRRFVDLQREAEGESVATEGRTTTSFVSIDIARLVVSLACDPAF